MKKPLIVVGTGIFVMLVMACGGLSNEEACKKVESLCNGSSGGGDGGVTVTTTTQCKPDNFDKMSNDSDVKDCIDKASACDAVLQCLLTAKPE